MPGTGSNTVAADEKELAKDKERKGVHVPGEPWARRRELKDTVGGAALQS